MSSEALEFGRDVATYCCMDEAGADFDCELVNSLKGDAPKLADTVRLIIAQCRESIQAELETPVEIRRRLVSNQITDTKPDAMSSRISAAFNFLQSLGVLERAGPTRTRKYVIYPSILSTVCRAQLQGGEVAGRVEARTGLKKQKIPSHSSGVPRDNDGIQAFIKLLKEGADPETDFAVAARGLVQEIADRTNSLPITRVTAQRAIKSYMNTEGYGTDYEAGRRVAQLAAVLKSLRLK